MTSYNPKKDNLSKYSNMLLQMTQKVGGILWTLKTLNEDVLCIGIQVVSGNNGKKIAIGVA